MSNYAKALQNVTGFVRRWKNNLATRINRRQDDLINSLGEALKLLEARSDSNYPAVTSIDLNLDDLSLGGTATTGLVITGTNFVGDADTASGSTSDSAGQLDFVANYPGEQTITVTIDLSDNGVSADVDAGTVTISIAGTEDADAVIAEIAAHAMAKYMITATSPDGAALIDTAETVSVTNTTGVADPGTTPVMYIGSQSFSGSTAGFGVTSWSDTQIVFDMDQTALGTDACHHLRLWIDDVLILEHLVQFSA